MRTGPDRAVLDAKNVAVVKALRTAGREAGITEGLLQAGGVGGDRSRIGCHERLIRDMSMPAMEKHAPACPEMAKAK